VQPSRTFYHYDELVEWFNGPDPPPGQSKVVPHLLPDDPTDRERFQSLLPLQVFSCWNGATIIDANAFTYPNNIRFRQAKNDLDENGKSRYPTQKESECFLSSVDLGKAGMGKILVVPKARQVSHHAFLLSLEP
jgi:alpha-1,3-mannosyltransferase